MSGTRTSNPSLAQWIAASRTCVVSPKTSGVTRTIGCLTTLVGVNRIADAFPVAEKSDSNQMRSLTYGGSGTPGVGSPAFQDLFRKSMTQSLNRSFLSTMTACRFPQTSQTPMTPLPNGPCVSSRRSSIAHPVRPF